MLDFIEGSRCPRSCLVISILFVCWYTPRLQGEDLSDRDPGEHAVSFSPLFFDSSSN